MKAVRAVAFPPDFLSHASASLSLRVISRLVRSLLSHAPTFYLEGISGRSNRIVPLRKSWSTTSRPSWPFNWAARLFVNLVFFLCFLFGVATLVAVIESDFHCSFFSPQYSCCVIGPRGFFAGLPSHSLGSTSTITLLSSSEQTFPPMIRTHIFDIMFSPDLIFLTPPVFRLPDCQSDISPCGPVTTSFLRSMWRNQSVHVGRCLAGLLAAALNPVSE